MIRLPAQGRSYDFTVESHTQETLASVRRHVLHKVKASPQAFRVELYINGETLDHTEDKKCVGEIPAIRDETVRVGIGPGAVAIWCGLGAEVAFVGNMAWLDCVYELG